MKVPMDDLNNHYIAKLEAENKSLQEKLVTLEARYRVQFKSTSDLMESNDALESTIEALNLRVARLVEACKPLTGGNVNDFYNVPNTYWDRILDVKYILSATPEDGQAWLREYGVGIIERAKQRFKEYEKEFRTDELFISSVIVELDELILELRSQQSKGGE